MGAGVELAIRGFQDEPEDLYHARNRLVTYWRMLRAWAAKNDGTDPPSFSTATCRNVLKMDRDCPTLFPEGRWRQFRNAEPDDN